MKKLIYKFNGGYGAVLCNECNVIVDEGLSEAEAQEYYQAPVLCMRCKDAEKECDNLRITTLKGD